jgi:hypothetical protein
MAYIEDLRAFVEVAAQRSFPRAAAHLFTSQPTLSRPIGRLEREHLLKRSMFASDQPFNAAARVQMLAG